MHHLLSPQHLFPLFGAAAEVVRARRGAGAQTSLEQGECRTEPLTAPSALRNRWICFSLWEPWDSSPVLKTNVS